VSLDPEVRNRLYVRRVAEGLTQRQLAARLSAAQSHICNVESGRSEPSLDLLRRWAEALGLSLRISLDVNARE
jgi:transcriptional regulator with XRE-family HTH domain